MTKTANNTKATAKSPARKPRKATFLTIEVKGETRYQPVNKRAKEWASKLKAKALTKKQLQEVHKVHRVYQYTPSGVLRPIMR